jgi:glucan-binding YG repeat protein
MTEEWKALTDDEKVQYVGASNREKQRYEGEMRVFREKKAKELAAEKASAVITKPAEKLVGAKRPASAATAKGEGKASKKSKDAPAAAPAAPATPAAPAHPALAPALAAPQVAKKGGMSAKPGKKSATKASTPAKKPAEVAKASAKKKETPIKAATPAKKSTTKKSP